MKKWIALTLALILSLSLAACGGQGGTRTPDAGQPDEQTAAPTDESTDAAPDESTDAAAPDESAPADADATLPDDNAAPDESTQIANPFMDYAAYEEAETAAGFSFGVPEEIGGYKATDYRVAENLSLFEVIYEKEAASMTARKAQGGWNISGDYNQYTVEVAETLQGVNVTCWGEGDALFLAVWTADDYSYSLSATESMDRADFLGAVETIIALNAD